MTDASEPKSLGAPTVDQCEAVYGSMLEPTTRSFHAKLLDVNDMTLAMLHEIRMATLD